MYQKTVLLAEDDRDTRYVYATSLRRAGYRVIEAADGEEAIAVARRDGPDVIIMDLGLPLLDGWQVTEALKRDLVTASIPVLAITVFVEDFYRGRAQAVGCDYFLDKPCSPTRLLEEVARFAAR